MWRMQDGDRVLTEAEWALFRVGLGDLWDFIVDDRGEDAGLSETGVRVFDVLQTEQKIALLADVAQALRDPAIPTPRHTAANEGAIAAVFATLQLALETDLHQSAEEDDDPTEIRSLLAAADSEDPPEEIPDPTEGSIDACEAILERIEGRIFWDADYEMGDEFLDRPPEEARLLLAQLTIDPDYYTAIPREPDRRAWIAACQTLARLLGRPVPGDDGLYPAFEDLFHHLTVGPCSPEEIAAWADHPWIDVIGLVDPGWDCDYAMWSADFRDALPSEPYALPPPAGAVLGSPDGDELPDQLQAEQQGDGWVIRDEMGAYWCDVLRNGWGSLSNDDMPALTFATRAAAVGAYRSADRMYGERRDRNAAALRQLGHPDDDAS